MTYELSPSPTQSAIGGAFLALAVSSLAYLNGSVLGCSGLAHRSIRFSRSSNWLESFSGTVGIVAAGLMSGTLLGRDPPAFRPYSVWTLCLSGLLVGIG